MATRTSNASSTAGRKDFSTVPQFLATIDFGTTHCSVAYLLRPDLEPNLTPSEVDPIVLKLDNDGNRRVPSCILFDPNGSKIAFGQEAREQYSALDHEERPLYHYFEHVKKNLQHDEVTIYTVPWPNNAGCGIVCQAIMSLTFLVVSCPDYFSLSGKIVW